MAVCAHDHNEGVQKGNRRVGSLFSSLPGLPWIREAPKLIRIRTNRRRGRGGERTPSPFVRLCRLYQKTNYARSDYTKTHT